MLQCIIFDHVLFIVKKWSVSTFAAHNDLLTYDVNPAHWHDMVLKVTLICIAYLRDCFRSNVLWYGSHIVTCKQLHICLYPQVFPRWRHHAYMRSERHSSSYYTFIDPKRMNGWVGWHTADGFPRGHLSTASHGTGQGKLADHRPTF